MHIGILQTGHVAEALIQKHGDYDIIFPAFLDGYGFTFSNYPVVDMVFPQDIHAADGWLITGSKFGAYEDLPWIKPLEDLIREIYAAHVPMVGICFGHQIIAEALGGTVEKFNKGWAVGRQIYEFEDIGEVALNAWHQDQVTQRPEGAKVIAANAFCENAALAYDDRVLTYQPHPEFLAPYLTGLLKVRAPGVVPAPLIRAAFDDIEKPVATQAFADRIAAFFKHPRTSHG
jgi:GMP synthase (glutamine-hydrolysing)